MTRKLKSDRMREDKHFVLFQVEAEDRERANRHELDSRLPEHEREEALECQK